MDCPNPDCKDRVAGHHHTLYGKDGRGGLVRGENELKNCLVKKVSRKGMIITSISIIVALMGSVGTFGVYGLEALKKDRAVVAENTNDIIAINKDIESINISILEGKKSIEEVKELIQKVHIKPADLKKLIIDAVKEGAKSP